MIGSASVSAVVNLWADRASKSRLIWMRTCSVRRSQGRTKRNGRIWVSLTGILMRFCQGRAPLIMAWLRIKQPRQKCLKLGSLSCRSVTTCGTGPRTVVNTMDV
jgi:hypothetical protein